MLIKIAVFDKKLLNVDTSRQNESAFGGNRPPARHVKTMTKLPLGCSIGIPQA